MKKKLILVRHGQSTYNLKNKFTGWKDVPLTNKGIKEAEDCSKLLKSYNIDACYTSELKRAQHTLSIINNNLNINPVIYKSILLNERDYGDLVGKNKSETAQKYGHKQVEIWRRSYDVPPPGGESLKMTCERVIPYFKKTILSNIFKNNHKNIIIAAHGNSIRAIVMNVLNFTSEQILKTEIGWCEPWILYFNNNNLVDFKIIPRINTKTMSSIPFKSSFKKIGQL